MTTKLLLDDSSYYSNELRELFRTQFMMQ